MSIYKVKLSFWLTPAKVRAESKDKAIEWALRNFPTCDCCDSKTKVEWVK